MKPVTFLLCCCSMAMLQNIEAQTETKKSLFENDAEANEIVLSEEQLADFKDKSLRKTKSLSNYISIIADKSKEETQRNKAIDLASKLFMNENHTVEVSSLGSQNIKQYKIRAYLNKLKLLPYSRVDIKWFDIFFASDFTKRPDGRYEAVASIYQRFEGTRNEGGVYKDITKKNIQIIIEQIEIKTGDQIAKVWEIFLGDIKVEETKKG